MMTFDFVFDVKKKGYANRLNFEIYIKYRKEIDVSGHSHLPHKSHALPSKNEIDTCTV